MNTKPAQIALFLAVFLALPFVGVAAQKMITVDSVTSAYQTKMSAFDAHTKVLEDSINGKCDEIVVQHFQLKPQVATAPVVDCNGIERELSQINQDRHILTVSYQLMLDSLK